MNPSSALKLLALSLTSLSAGVLAAAAEERPRMEDYPSSYAFLQALESWNKSLPGKAPPPPPPPPTPIVVTDPTSEQAPPPFEITGPESLDVAVEKARYIDHPAYKEKTRYRRTTHISFPLPSIDGQDMSQASVGNTLDIKGHSDDAKQELERLTQQMEQDRLNQLQSGSSTEQTAVPTQIQLNNGMLGSRPPPEITVTSH
jgi:hypothetical protein